MTSNIGKRVWMGIFEWHIVNKFELIYIDDWTFTGMDTKIGSLSFYT